MDTSQDCLKVDIFRPPRKQSPISWSILAVWTKAGTFRETLDSAVREVVLELLPTHMAPKIALEEVPLSLECSGWWHGEWKPVSVLQDQSLPPNIELPNSLYPKHPQAHILKKIRSSTFRGHVNFNNDSISLIIMNWRFKALFLIFDTYITISLPDPWANSPMTSKMLCQRSRTVAWMQI